MYPVVRGVSVKSAPNLPKTPAEQLERIPVQRIDPEVHLAALNRFRESPGPPNFIERRLIKARALIDQGWITHSKKSLKWDARLEYFNSRPYGPVETDFNYCAIGAIEQATPLGLRSIVKHRLAKAIKDGDDDGYYHNRHDWNAIVNFNDLSRTKDRVLEVFDKAIKRR